MPEDQQEEKAVEKKKRGRKPKAAKTANRGRPGRPAKHAGSKQAKSAMGKAGKVGRRKRYSEEAKKELLARYESYRMDGLTAQDAARKAGVPYITLRSWHADSGTGPRRRGRPPKADKARRGRPRKQSQPGRPAGNVASTGALVLVTPSGYRIEAISPKDLVRVLEELR